MVSLIREIVKDQPPERIVDILQKPLTQALRLIVSDCETFLRVAELMDIPIVLVETLVTDKIHEIQAFQFPEKCFCVIGSEKLGICQNMLGSLMRQRTIDEKLYFIFVRTSCLYPSLNVSAAVVLMWSFYRLQHSIFVNKVL